MNTADENREIWLNKWGRPANEEILKQKFIQRKDHCWWCNKEFKDRETKVTHGVFNVLGVYFCDNNECLDNFFDCNNLQYKEIKYEGKGTSI